eukprot:scaffold121_cov412-Prasinococcus_capsulatus_cf.AAC.26
MFARIMLKEETKRIDGGEGRGGGYMLPLGRVENRLHGNTNTPALYMYCRLFGIAGCQETESASMSLGPPRSPEMDLAERAVRQEQFLLEDSSLRSSLSVSSNLEGYVRATTGGIARCNSSPTSTKCQRSHG